ATSAAFSRARELAGRVEDPSERFSAYWGLWNGHFMRGEPAPMREVVELFLRETTGRRGCPEAGIAHRMIGSSPFYFGDCAAAHDHFQKSLELYEPAQHSELINRFGQHPRVAAASWDAVALWFLGRIYESSRLADRALADAKAAAHVPTMGIVLNLAALLGLLRYDPEPVTTCSQALADIVSRYDLPAFWVGCAACFQGWTRWLRGEGQVGLTEMRRGLAIVREQGHLLFLPIFEPALAEAEASAG